MSLTPEQRIGPYEVLGPLGAGGMGEVYRATDTHLKRPVALKVLPPSVAGDADRLARFQREAEVLAALNHPHIAQVYGLEKSGGTTALVMELVDGDDLSQLISRGPIPLADALPIARQIADALEAAHEQGIVHRDLKPANIKVRHDGTVKVLDFGLAKAFVPAVSTSAGMMDSPTLTTPAMTQMGMILGTAAYMSPEQARGKPVDRRADIWAFGAVVYEMLTGRRAFPGEDTTDTIVSVVSKEPDWSALPPVPSALRRLLVRCLKKDPKARLRDIGEARVHIDDLLSGVSDEPVRHEAALSRKPSRAVIWAAAVAGLAVVIAALWLWAPWRSAASSRPTLSYTPLSFEQGGQTAAVWSPDGKAVSFGARHRIADPSQIFVRYLNSPVATQITNTAGSLTPVAWTTSGKIVFASTETPVGLWSISPVGGDPELLQQMDRPASATISPDGTAVAWFHTEDGLDSIWISSPIGSSPKPYLPAPFSASGFVNAPTLKFSPDGKQILYCRNAGPGEEIWLMPYPADPAVPPRRIFQQLRIDSTPTFSWMPDSRRIVISLTSGAAPESLYIADTISESLSVLSSGTRRHRSPAVSPRGDQLIFMEADVDFDIVSVDLAAATVTPLIATQRSEQMPAWSVSGDAMVYVTDRNGGLEVWVRKPGQPDRPVVTAADFPPDTTLWFMGPVLSPDGTRVMYTRNEVKGRPILWMSALAGGAPVRLTNSDGVSEYAGSWSPDGKWVTFLTSGATSSVSKVKTAGQSTPEILKLNPDRSGASWVPLWSPSGEWILYPDAGPKLISPDGKTSRDVPSPRGASLYAFSRDGQTLYGIRAAAVGVRAPASREIELFSVPVAGGAEKLIALMPREHLPSVGLGPSLRATVTPDGGGLTYSIGKRTFNLWLLNGLDAIEAR